MTTDGVTLYTDGASRGNPGDAAWAYVIVRDGTVAGYALFDKGPGEPELLLHPSDTRTGLRYSLLPMTRSIIGGLFIVPLQVFMQARPPEDQKGRMIGAMNLVNWIAILFAAAGRILS